MRCFCGIVTYNPSIDRLLSNINSIINQVSELVIVDNNSNNINDICDLLNGFSNISIIRNNKNEGIAFALNSIVQCAVEKNYDWVLTLDQDTISPNDLIDLYKNYCNIDVAVISPLVLYDNNEIFTKIPTTKFDLIDWAITSASFINVNAWNKINGFDNNLFIDWVDYDFCIRAKNVNYKIIRVNSAIINHQLGELYCRKIFGRTIYCTNHSYVRQYYMSRNAIYLKKKNLLKHPYIFIMKHIIKIILFEKDKVRKLKYIRKGIKDSKSMNHINS